ncbi:Uncharacterised protein [Vibrio cholerae]|nr:Uncharacterised protein [Vibrio cholerae]
MRDLLIVHVTVVWRDHGQVEAFLITCFFHQLFRFVEIKTWL